MNDLQKLVKDFCIENDMNSSVETCFMDLTSELGEVGKEILKSTDYGKTPFAKSRNFEMELGDLLYSLLTLANNSDVDISKALYDVLDKYKKRLEKGSAGSEND